MAAPIGTRSLALTYGGDFQLDANGKLVTVTDTLDDPAATKQRLYLLMMTAPRPQDIDGVSTGRPDDLFHPDWGVGLARLVGKNITPALVANVTAQFRSVASALPGVAASPPPSIGVTVSGATVTFTGSFTDDVGQTHAIPTWESEG